MKTSWSRHPDRYVAIRAYGKNKFRTERHGNVTMHHPSGRTSFTVSCVRYHKTGRDATIVCNRSNHRLEQARAPRAPGIYPVSLSTGERTCAKWDGTGWFLWDDIFDPPEWDAVEHLNCKVIEWRMP